jgi:hypothetical protein
MSEDPESGPGDLVARLGCGALAMFIGGGIAWQGLLEITRWNIYGGILALIFGVAIFCIPFKELLDL